MKLSNSSRSTTEGLTQIVTKKASAVEGEKSNECI